MKKYLSVVIPAYNEATNYLSGVLDPAISFLEKQKYPWEVLFVDDGSTDNTKQLLRNFCRQHHHCKLATIKHGGKAAAVTAGILKAAGEIILMTDFDQSTPLNQVKKFIAAHKKGYHLAIGSRGKKFKTEKDTLFRRFRGHIWVTIVQLVLSLGITDTQCGFKSFTKVTANRLFKNLKVTNIGKVVGGYMGAWDIEVLFLAKKAGHKIVEIPVRWVKIPGNRLNPWKEPLMMIRDAFKIRMFDLQGKYQGL